MRAAQLLNAVARRYDPRVFVLDADRNYVHAALSSGIGYTRSGGIYVPQSDGSLLTVASDVIPRAWDSTAGWGFRVDPGWTQLLTYSHDPSNAAWTKGGLASTPAQSQIGPGGAMDAWALVEDASASATHGLSRTVSFTAGTTVTLVAVFAALPGSPAVRRGRISLPASAFGSALVGTVDLATGATAGGAPAMTAVQLGSTGYWVTSTTATPTTTASGTITVGMATSAGSGTYTGDGASGLRLLAVNLTTTAYPVPLVLSTSAATTIGTPTWFSLLSALGINLGAQYSLGIEFEHVAALSGSVDAMQLDNGGSSERSLIRIDAGGAAIRSFVVAGGASGGTRGPFTVSAGSVIKAGAAFAAGVGSGSTYFNGQLPSGSAAITMPAAPDRLRLGGGVGVNYGAMLIKRAWISPAFLPAGALQSYTR